MVRTSKKVKYKKEQGELVNKLLEILPLEDNGFTLYEMDNNKERQEKILELKGRLLMRLMKIISKLFSEKKSQPVRTEIATERLEVHPSKGFWDTLLESNEQFINSLMDSMGVPTSTRRN